MRVYHAIFSDKSGLLKGTKTKAWTPKTRPTQTSSDRTPEEKERLERKQRTQRRERKRKRTSREGKVERDENLTVKPAKRDGGRAWPGRARLVQRQELQFQC